jgi:hypothetical protein
VQVGFKMFLGVTATVTAWNNETTVRSKSNAPGFFLCDFAGAHCVAGVYITPAKVR